MHSLKSRKVMLMKFLQMIFLVRTDQETIDEESKTKNEVMPTPTVPIPVTGKSKASKTSLLPQTPPEATIQPQKSTNQSSSWILWVTVLGIAVIGGGFFIFKKLKQKQEGITIKRYARIILKNKQEKRQEAPKNAFYRFSYFLKAGFDGSFKKEVQGSFSYEITSSKCR